MRGFVFYIFLVTDAVVLVAAEVVPAAWYLPLHVLHACSDDDSNGDAFSTGDVVAALVVLACQSKAPVLQLRLSHSPLQTVH